MGASYPWTFDQSFAGNVAPDATETALTRQETDVTGRTIQETKYTTVARQETDTTGVTQNE